MRNTSRKNIVTARQNTSQRQRHPHTQTSASAVEAADRTPEMDIASGRDVHIQVSIYVSGGHQQFLIGSTSQAQTIAPLFQAGDTKGLFEALARLGLDREDIASLADVLTDDPASITTGQLGNKTTNWLKHMASKTAGNAGGATITVTTEILLKHLGVFFGWW